ncbi:T7SS effector LXG polymorphic toxin [Priestia megaterium]
MKVIKVAEILPELASSISSKEKEKKQILAVRDSMNRIIGLNSLSGKGADAIKENLVNLHYPTVILINYFLEEYTKQLKDIKTKIKEYENEDGLVRENFIETEVENSLKRLEETTQTIVESINKHIDSIKTVAMVESISTGELNVHLHKARVINKETLTKLNELDAEVVKGLKDPVDTLNELKKLINQVSNWSKGGVNLTTSTLEEINEYMNKDSVNEAMENALEQSADDGEGDILTGTAGVLDKLGKVTAYKDIAKGVTAATVLLSGKLKITKGTNGLFKLVAGQGWKKQNGKYPSMLANIIHKVLTKGASSNIKFVQNKFEKFKNQPVKFLKHLAGFKEGTTKRAYRTILEEHFSFLKFNPEKVNAYSKFPVDVKATLKQATHAKGVSTLLKKIPLAGIAVSVVMNSGEIIGPKSRNKSTGEKIGRFSAGLGLDAGVTGITLAGAAIGTAIAPGPGTFIGGAIGASIGVVASLKVEDKVKAAGEKLGRFAEEKSKKLGNIVTKSVDNLSNTGKFVTGIFR